MQMDKPSSTIRDVASLIISAHVACIGQFSKVLSPYSAMNVHRIAKRRFYKAFTTGFSDTPCCIFPVLGIKPAVTFGA